MKINYRDVLYRYSTGLGPDFAPSVESSAAVTAEPIELPEQAIDYASFKMKPQMFPLGRCDVNVNLKRQADRVSMQFETAQQMIKTLGGNFKARKELQNLKCRLDVVNFLLFNTPLTYIKLSDLEHLHAVHQCNPRFFPNAVKIMVRKNLHTGGTYRLANKVYSAPNVPAFDTWGKVPSLGDWNNISSVITLPTLLGIGLLWLALRKYS